MSDWSPPAASRVEDTPLRLVGSTAAPAHPLAIF
jgi:hypothetical protein